MRSLRIWATAVMLIGLVGQTAMADDTDVASQADETFRAGRELLKDKRYAEASAKFKQSEAQDAASGTLLALAYCQELSGLLATSWASYGAAAELAAREGHSERQTAANERVRALAARVSKLTVVVPAELVALPGLHLTRDGAEVERASFGVPVPLDGGSHVFIATAPGRIAWTGTVTLLPERDEKTLELPNLDALQAPVVTPASAPPLAKPVTAPSPAPGANSADVNMRKVSLALAAGSAVALGLGTAFGLSAKSTNDSSNANGHCDRRGCDPQGVQLRNDSLAAARASTWSFVAGGALAAASISLYLGSNSSLSAASVTTVQAHVSLGESRVSVFGSF
ncbi:MAG: hypothetical protein ABI488_01120 [Polyangiaceae bacterium]